MLFTANKPCHVPHASRVTTSRKIFTEIFYFVFKELIRSWSYVSSLTNLKTFFKKLLASTDEKEKQKKKKRKAVAKRFALHTNANKVRKGTVSNLYFQY